MEYKSGIFIYHVLLISLDVIVPLGVDVTGVPFKQISDNLVGLGVENSGNRPTLNLSFPCHLVSLFATFRAGLPSASGEASAELTSRMAHAIRMDRAERAQPVLRPDTDRRQGAKGGKLGGPRGAWGCRFSACRLTRLRGITTPVESQGRMAGGSNIRTVPTRLERSGGRVVPRSIQSRVFRGISLLVLICKQTRGTSCLTLLSLHRVFPKTGFRTALEPWPDRIEHEEGHVLLALRQEQHHRAFLTYGIPLA